MAGKSTLKLLDELDTITQDFLSELSDMEIKRGCPAKRATLTEQTDVAKRATLTEQTDVAKKATLTEQTDVAKKATLTEQSDVAKRATVTAQSDVTDSAAEQIAPPSDGPNDAGPSPLLSSLHACRAPPSDGPNDAEEYYCMKHRRRGQCLIFVYKNFLISGFDERSSAGEDTEACKEAFKALNFEVEVFENLKTKELRAELDKASTRDHSDCDALVVVFMSHGDLEDGREALVTYDGKIYTAELWRGIAKCPSLQGKPKLFFIQACRGGGVEPSVGLKVSTDNVYRPEPIAEWNLGFDTPDSLVMQSSYEGMFSFRTERNSKQVSIFIYFLAQILKDKGSQKALSDLLLEVTRRMAVEYEASAKGKEYDKAKQMPLTRSTLTKNITFAMA